MKQELLAHPWESRKLYSFVPTKNRAISQERLENLKQLIRFDYEGFWSEAAKDIEWFRPWEKVMESGNSQSPDFSFFKNGYSNVCYNMLDRHLKNGAGNRLALIWENESGDKVEYYTYRDLFNEVCRFCNGLISIGCKKNDRIALFLPNSPAVAIAVMAAYRMGMAFTPLFTGLSVESLRSRLNSFEPQVIVTMDGTNRRGKALRLKEIIEKTLEQVKSVTTVIVKKNLGIDTPMNAGRDIWWHDLVLGRSCDNPPTLMEANEIQFVSYTSGTTGKPKGVALPGVSLAVQTCLGGKIESAVSPRDVFYSVNDNGWLGSQCHAILPVWLNGGTLVWQEGAGLAVPSLERFYSTIEKYNATRVHIAPTVLRMLRVAGEDIISRHDLSSLELILCMGEPLSPELWHWAVDKIGENTCLNNVGDMTELGGCIIQPAAFIDDLKPGSMGRIDSVMGGPAVAVVDDFGNESGINTPGNMVFKKPVPGAARTLWGNHDSYHATYFQKIDDQWIWYVYDEGVIDQDGYFWVLGRTDDVINVAGHRLSTSEIEGAILKSNNIEAAAVVGIPHEIKEQVPVAFVQLKKGVNEDQSIITAINSDVADRIGRYAQVDRVVFVDKMPVTISGKIMRRLLKDLLVHGEIKGDVTTLEDPGSIENIKAQLFN